MNIKKILVIILTLAFSTFFSCSTIRGNALGGELYIINITNKYFLGDEGSPFQELITKNFKKWRIIIKNTNIDNVYIIHIETVSQNEKIYNYLFYEDIIELQSSLMLMSDAELEVKISPENEILYIKKLQISYDSYIEEKYIFDTSLEQLLLLCFVDNNSYNNTFSFTSFGSKFKLLESDLLYDSDTDKKSYYSTNEGIYSINNRQIGLIQEIKIKRAR